MEDGEYGRTRGTCFVARRLEVVAVVQLLWRLCSVSGAAEFRVSFFVCFSSNALGLLQICTMVQSIPAKSQALTVKRWRVCRKLAPEMKL